jgi:magnesium chelatase family protein
VLFLDELPEFNRATLEALRQPLESGRIAVARANAHVTYPARVQLVAAMNPCRCGQLDDAALACGRAPRCAADYQSKISGPMFDRIDLHVDVAAVKASDLALPPPRESSAEVAMRVAIARERQALRYRKLTTNIVGTPIADPAPATPYDLPPSSGIEGELALLDRDGLDGLDEAMTMRVPHLPAAIRTNAEADGELLEKVANPDQPGRDLLTEAVDRFRLSARGYHRVLRTARTLADLEGADHVKRIHIAEALSYRRVMSAR